MQTLVCFSQPQPAHTLVDYLSSQRISSIIEHSDDHYCVMLEHADDYTQAKTIAAHYIDAPHDPRYQAASWESQHSGALLGNNGKGVFNQALRDSLQPMVAQVRQYPLTYVMLLINIVIFALMNLSYASSLWVNSHLFIVPLNELGQTSQWWRLLTPNLLHFSVLHIAFNLLWWWILARPIERYLGKLSLLITFVIISLSANLGQLYVDGPNFGGMSGVVYGLLGFTWWLGWLKPQWGFTVQPQIIGFMLVWLVIGYADVLFVSMANTAHTLGLVSGCLLAVVWTQLSRFGSTSAR